MGREKKKQPARLNEDQLNQFLQSFEENRMIDDHGNAIIGRRDKKPVIGAS
jgi:hypothetical protein